MNEITSGCLLFSWWMLLEYISIFELCSLAFRKKTETKGKSSCLGHSDWQNNDIIWSINFQINDEYAETDLGPSPTSTTALFTETASTINR